MTGVRALIALFGAASALAVGGAVIDEGTWRGFAVVALVVLAVFAVVTRRGVLLGAGLVLLALATGARRPWWADTGLSWPFSLSQAELRGELARYADGTLVRERVAAVVLLVAVVVLAAAARGASARLAVPGAARAADGGPPGEAGPVPPGAAGPVPTREAGPEPAGEAVSRLRGRRVPLRLRRRVAAGVAVLPALVVVDDTVDRWQHTWGLGPAEAAELAWMVAPAVAAVVAAAVAAGFAARRGWAATGGAVLLGVIAAVALDEVSAAWFSAIMYDDRGLSTFLAMGVMVSTGGTPRLDLDTGLTAAALLGAAALLAAGIRPDRPAE